MNQTPADTISMFEYVYRLWPIFLAFIGSIAWLLRIEAKQVYIERDIKILTDRITKKDEVMWSAINTLQKDLQKDIREILQHLGKIEGQLDHQNKNQ